MKLYVKTRCPWCVDAVAWLNSRGYTYDLIDVLANRADYDRMIEISGQRLTPTLQLDGGEVLPDFDVRQLEKFLKEHNLQPG
ncbi:MAG TPA: glutaredoxin domain-containing protein [Chthoniobacterales bacterium]|nr:glutaredoxin domain-containing protein [Chthoniobacterales bacterium]